MEKGSLKQDYIADIKALASELGLKKNSEIAKALCFSESSVSFWLRGDKRRPPSVEAFLRMADRTNDPKLAAAFLRHARMDPRAIGRISAKLSGFHIAPPSEGDVIRVSRYRQTAQGREEAGPPVPLPAEFLPGQGRPICLLIDNLATGVVDAPLGLFIVDISVENSQDLSDLWGRVVMLEFSPRGETSRWPKPGIYVGRLLNDLIRRKHGTVGLPSELSVGAYMNLLTAEAFSSIELGEWRHPRLDEFAFRSKKGADGAISSSGEFENPKAKKWLTRAKRETEERAPRELRLDKGFRILGRVLGRLSGNVK